MSRLSRFRGKAAEVDIEGEKFKLHPISFAVFMDTTDLYEKKKNKEAMNAIIFHAMKRSLKDENVSDDELRSEIESMDASIALKLLTTVMEISGLQTKKESE